MVPASIFASSDHEQTTEMVHLDKFAIDQTEVSIGSFARFAEDTGFVTSAERAGGGLVYENGWTKKVGWNWKTPFGEEADPREPAVHITFDEAEEYCRWAGKRLPTEQEWRLSAYTEQRQSPEVPFVRGTRYTYPTGDQPDGAHCLGDCVGGIVRDYSRYLDRGQGPALVGTTQKGVNGLFDMGANVWEWARSGDGHQQPTMGGSWWYGSWRMRHDNEAAKPRDMAVVYIGFRCAKTTKPH